MEAHNQAVENTIKYIESLAMARHVRNETTEFIKTGNIVAASFNHSVSRSNDPQLHSHVIIANMTQTDNGWKSLSNEIFFLNQQMINQIYQNELASNIVKLGYAIDRHNNTFELSNYPTEPLELFSKRSTEINSFYSENIEALKEKYQNASEAELRDIVTLASRNAKDHHITSQELRDKWQNEFPREQILNNLELTKSQRLNSHPMEKSIEIITENQSVFSKNDLLLTDLRSNVGTKTINDSEIEFKAKLTTEHIQNIGDTNTKIGTKTINLEQSLFTTSDVLQTEMDVLNKVANQEKIKPLISKDRFTLNGIDHNLNYKQTEFLQASSTTDKPYFFMQGDAGAGKTYALYIYAQVNHENAHILGAALTGKAASEIEAKTNGLIPSFTLHHIINSWEEHFKPEIPSVLIVDEASMISTKQYSEIINKAEETNTRVIFIGDTKQLQPVGAGQLFKDIIDKFGADVVMDGNLRQKTTLTQEAVELVKQQHQYSNDISIQQAITLLKTENNVYEDNNFNNVIEKAIDKYVNDYKENKDTLLITHKNDIKDDLNNGIRENLTDDNTEKFELTVREQANISPTEKFNSHSYTEGQNIFFSSITGDIKAGSEWKIDNINHESNSLGISNQKGITETISLSDHGNHISAFTEQTREFTIGEKIVFEKNDYLLNIRNGHTGHIESFQEGVLTIAKENGESISFKPESYNYIDYGYALTVHKSQGQTCNTVLYVAESNDKMVNSESFYVAVTRATDEIKIYTDNTDKLAERASQHENEHSLHDLLEKQQTHENEINIQMEI